MKLLHEEEYSDFGSWLENAEHESKNPYIKRKSTTPNLTSRPSFVSRSRHDILRTKKDIPNPSLGSLDDFEGIKHLGSGDELSSDSNSDSDV